MSKSTRNTVAILGAFVIALKLVGPIIETAQFLERTFGQTGGILVIFVVGAIAIWGINKILS